MLLRFFFALFFFGIAHSSLAQCGGTTDGVALTDGKLIIDGLDMRYASSPISVTLNQNKIILEGEKGNDCFDGGSMLGRARKSLILIGNDGEDVLIGGQGDDLLFGAKANKDEKGSYHASDHEDDNVKDYLDGGLGVDLFYVGWKDIVVDGDGLGEIFLLGQSLKGRWVYDRKQQEHIKKELLPMDLYGETLPIYIHEAGFFAYKTDNKELIIMDFNGETWQKNKENGRYLTIDYWSTMIERGNLEIRLITK